MTQNDRRLSLRPFWPLLEESFWDFEKEPSNLSISEDEQHVFVEAALPGLKPEDIEVTFEKGVLWIKGEAKEETENKKRKYYRKASRSFSYRVQVPGQIDEKKDPEATYKDGIMKIAFMKTPQPEPKKIQVKAK